MGQIKKEQVESTENAMLKIKEIYKIFLSSSFATPCSLCCHCGLNKPNS
jgi:hypothetical protein